MKEWAKLWVLLAVLATAPNSGAQQKPSELLYKDQVGYLPPSNKDHSEDFIRCNPNLPLGFYSSSGPYIYKGNKSKFRKFILDSFNNNDFDDNGILNLRFIINCHGEVGDIEVNELDYGFEKITMSNALVDKLKELAFKRENWNFNLVEKPMDYYMYLLFRIENGKVVEILP